jgi:primase-polymerase (primpol)-like protein
MLLMRDDAKFCTQKCGVYYRRSAHKNPILPAEMTNSSRWMRWKMVQRGSRATKMPVTLAGRAASSTDAATWTDYRSAAASDLGNGLGFALGEGVGCIDLDHCLNDGVVADWAQRILDSAPDTYVEVSQSKTGLHIFGLLPEAPGRNIRRGDYAVEFYSVGRFIAVTGDRFGNSPAVLADLSEVVASIS